MRIAILDDYQDAARRFAPWDRQLPAAELVAFTEHIHDIDSLAERLAPFDVVVAMRERTPFPRALLQRLPALRLLVTTGARNVAIDVVAASQLGITVCGTGSIGTGTAELTWGLILALARHIVAEDAAARSGRWQHTIGTDLAGKILGVVGLGRIGTHVAAIGNAFGMQVSAWSPHLDAARADAAGAALVSKAELFAAADIVTLHLVLSDSTRGVVGRSALQSMKPGALLVNTARAGLVDTAALIEVLRSGHLGGAGIDVFDEEPLTGHEALLGQERLVVTPHLGYVTEATYRRFYGDALDDIVAFAAGHPIRVLGPEDGTPPNPGTSGS